MSFVILNPLFLYFYKPSFEFLHRTLRLPHDIQRKLHKLVDAHYAIESWKRPQIRRLPIGYARSLVKRMKQESTRYDPEDSDSMHSSGIEPTTYLWKKQGKETAARKSTASWRYTPFSAVKCTINPYREENPWLWKLLPAFSSDLKWNSLSIPRETRQILQTPCRGSVRPWETISSSTVECREYSTIFFHSYSLETACRQNTDVYHSQWAQESQLLQ